MQKSNHVGSPGLDAGKRHYAEKSIHHTKQSQFKGSNRELRSHILKEILKSPQTLESLHTRLRKPIIAIDSNLKAMKKEGFIKNNRGVYSVQ